MRFLLFLVLIAFIAGCAQQTVDAPSSEQHKVLEKQPVPLEEPHPEPLPPRSMEEIEHISENEALRIAKESNCASEGALAETGTYDEAIHAWSFDLEIEGRGDCPVCVVYEALDFPEIHFLCE
ncbi:MAG: hypothetical protein ACE5DM_04720 [Candidatus Nanoarchaeia archaeon]